MSDSNTRDDLAEKHERNREQRLKAVKRWVAYIQETPPEKWGAEQNAVVNAQIESAQRVALPAAHRKRVREIASNLHREHETD